MLFVLVVLVWSCAGSGDDDDISGDDAAPPTTETTPEPPAFVPITGGTDEDGQPEPPPVHAVFSVVVRGDTSWAPYAGPELDGLDTEAAEAIGQRLRQIHALLGPNGVPASIELAYGPAAALCELDPDLLTALEEAGHRIGMHARSTGEAFRAHDALERCGRVPTTVSGLASMADPHGPDVRTIQTVNDAMAILSVLDLHQVVGRVSPLCTDLALAAPTHGYGTGSFTAPWRSAWTEGQPCTDLPRGRIVMIDQNILAPGDGDVRVDADAVSVLRSRTEQALGYALEKRFAEPEALPAPGMITWGVSVRLDDLIAPPPPPPDEDEDEDETGDDSEADDVDQDSETEESVAPVDPRIAPLSEETLAELALMIDELWLPSMEQGRLRWMLPDDVALLLRPLPELADDPAA